MLAFLSRGLRIALMTEAVITSEKKVIFSETTLRSIPKGYCLHIHRREKLKSQLSKRCIGYFKFTSGNCVFPPAV
jgi:hypothetical protein